MSAFCEAEGLVLGTGSWCLTPEPLTFGLPAGKITALVGKNGAGKTTLLRALLGEPVVLGGDLRLAGLDARRASYTDRARAIAFVPQEHEFPGDATVETTLKIAFLPRMGLWGGLPEGAQGEVDRSLESFGLISLRDRRLRDLSTGERQRAFLARAVLQHPKALILDEPTNHLDPAAVRDFWKALIAQTRERQLELLVSTHDLDFLRGQCDHILALDTGRIAFSGSREEFLADNVEARLFGSS
jgi:ABC-type cobalamin/Fe3+-siderophores transport system ATPase subunit